MKYLEEIHKKYVEDYENGEKSEKQKKNWATMAELKKVMNSIFRDIKERELFKKTESVSVLLMVVLFHYCQ